MPIAVSRGGIDEWPGVACAFKTSVIAFFGNADQRGGLVEALHDAFGDQQALVDHEVEANAARGE